MDLNETYTELLYPFGRGYALWAGSGESCACIGDVGFIVLGSFVRLFNVHLAHDHPIQHARLPEDYTPLLSRPQIRSRELQKQTLSATSVATHSEVFLEISASGRSEDTEDTRIYRDYMRDHIPLLESIAEDYEIKLEELLLVTGRDLARSWRAVVSNECCQAATLPPFYDDEKRKEACLFVRHLRVRKRVGVRRGWFDDRWEACLDWMDEVLGGEPETTIRQEYHPPTARALDHIFHETPVHIAIISDDDLAVFYQFHDGKSSTSDTHTLHISLHKLLGNQGRSSCLGWVQYISQRAITTLRHGIRRQRPEHRFLSAITGFTVDASPDTLIANSYPNEKNALEHL